MAGLRGGPHAGEGEEDGDDGGHEAVELGTDGGIVGDDCEDDCIHMSVQDQCDEQVVSRCGTYVARRVSGSP